MTTAHRPTWKAAVGKAQEGGYTGVGAPSTQRSILDAPAHTKLKTRTDIHALQSTERDAILTKSLLKIKEMEEKNSKFRKKSAVGPRVLDARVEEEGRRKLLLSENDVDEVKFKTMYDYADDDEDDNDENDRFAGGNNVKGDGWSDVEDVINEESDLDATDSDSEDESEDDSDDDQDEEDLLQAELAKIRAEREKVKEKMEAEAAEEERGRMEEAALIGNPLLNASAIGSGTGKLKRRWNDDVVFRNQAKGEPDQNKKRFINDTVRNDFHKRFLNKFIK
jgi:protein CWC15